MNHPPPPSSAKKRRYTDPFTRNPASVPKGWRNEERDQAIPVDIYTHEGLLTKCQIEALHFAPDQPTDNPRSAKRSAETRSQYLFHSGYLDRMEVQSLGPGRSTIANVLAPAGVDFVTARLGADRKQVNWRPKIVKNKPTSLYHSILVNDVRIVFERIERTTDLTLKTWLGERMLKSKQMADKIPFLQTGTRKSAKKAPDGAFALEYPAHEYGDQPVQPAGFFLEVDRGTESNAVWGEKVTAYEQFRQSGLPQKYYGVTNFRVLVTVSSPQRLHNLVKTTLKAGGGHFYWFCLQQQIDIFRPWGILGEIWMVAGWEGQYSLKTLIPNPKVIAE